jgi:Ca2+-binding RTX toxin-like protein
VGFILWLYERVRYQRMEERKVPRIATVLAVVGLCVVMFAAAALAVNKQCTDYPCFGTSDGDTLYERGGDGVNDRIYSKPGNDVVRVNTFTSDHDIIFGGLGRDRLNADDGDERDEVYGERGFDRCHVDARVEAENSCNALWVNGVRVR